LTVERAVIGLVAAVIGGFVVGPRLADAVQRWIGWRVVLPLMLGFVPARADLGPPVRRTDRGARSVRAIQLVTAVVFGIVGARLGWSAALVPILILSAGLVALSAVDLACWRIPSRFVYLTGTGVVAGLVAASLAAGEPEALVGMAVGGGSYLVLLGSLHLLSPRMLGFGDVRLGVLIGLAVGWMGWRADYPVYASVSWTMLSMFIASLVGTVAGVVVLAGRRRARRLSDRPLSEPYPFGPWLCAGGLIAILLAAPGPA
jgi:leader peptidase (prepilin peptidase)/N-methyltransferase